jgi:hypothetical protein
MSDPARYIQSFNFSAFQAVNPATPLPAPQVDAQFQDIATSTGQLVDAVKDIRRSDGALKNGIVTTDSLEATLAQALSGPIDAASVTADRIAAQAAASAASSSASSAAASAASAAALAGANATSIVFTPAGGLSSTNASAAILEVNARIGTSGTAASTTVAAIAGLTATDVQAALAELLADINNALPRTGAVVLSIDDAVPPGWLLMDDTTIGDASSGATHAHATLYQALYILLWTKVSNTYAPVSLGRGLTAAADYAAHKTITLTKAAGRALGVAGAGAGLTARTVGQTFGEEGHALTGSENGPHNHPVFLNDPGHFHTFGIQNNVPTTGAVPFPNESAPSGTQQTLPASTGITVRDTIGGGGTANQTAVAGVGDPHNTMQPTLFLYAWIKL